MIKKAFLDRMYFRLHERKEILADMKGRKSIDLPGLKAMHEAILAIECSIADYIETHQKPGGGHAE